MYREREREREREYKQLTIVSGSEKKGLRKKKRVKGANGTKKKESEKSHKV